MSKKRPECISQLRKKRRRAKLPNTVTIDSIYEKNFLSLNSVLESVIVDAFVLPGTLNNGFSITCGNMIIYFLVIFCCENVLSIVILLMGLL